jgi:hypothetical protein
LLEKRGPRAARRSTTVIDFNAILGNFLGNPTAQAALRTVMLYLTGLYLATIFWAARDAASRVADRRAVFVLGLVAAIPFIGMALYILIRPTQTLAEAREAELAGQALEAELARTPRCQSCEAPAEAEWRYCARCSAVLTSSCPSCSKTVRTGWSACPFCAAELGARGWRLEPELTPVPRTA